MLKILQVRLLDRWMENFQMFKLNLEKAEEPEIKLQTSAGSLKKQESSRKKHLFLLYLFIYLFLFLLYWLCQSLWLCGSQQTGKVFKRLGYHTTFSASWEIYMQVRKQQLELDMEQQTGSKSGKDYDKAVYYHPAYLTYIESTSWEMLGWKKHKLESRLLEDISITSRYADDTMLMAEWE